MNIKKLYGRSSKINTKNLYTTDFPQINFFEEFENIDYGSSVSGRSAISYNMISDPFSSMQTYNSYNSNQTQDQFVESVIIEPVIIEIVVTDNSKKIKDYQNEIQVLKDKLTIINDTISLSNKAELDEEESNFEKEQLANKAIELKVKEKNVVAVKKEKVENKWLDSYDLIEKRKIWKTHASYNNPSQGCDGLCKKEHVEKTILFKNGKHICYSCWIKKPKTEVRTKASNIKN